MASKKKIYRSGYISEIDRFLRDFDENRTELPLARQMEQARHQQIAAKRDGIVEQPDNFIWKDF